MFTVKKFNVHPSYDLKNKDADIAMIEVINLIIVS